MHAIARRVDKLLSERVGQREAEQFVKVNGPYRGRLERVYRKGVANCLRRSIENEMFFFICMSLLLPSMTGLEETIARRVDKLLSERVGQREAEQFVKVNGPYRGPSRRRRILDRLAARMAAVL
jgi:hypothetical protein